MYKFLSLTLAVLCWAAIYVAPVGAATAPVSIERLLSTQTGGIAPPESIPGKIQVDVTANSGTFTRIGPDGIVTFTWLAPGSAGRADRLGSLGEIDAECAVDAPRARPVLVIARPHIELAALEPMETVSFGKVPGGARLVQRFTTGTDVSTVTTTVTEIGKSLVIDVGCDKPSLSSFDLGWVAPTLGRPIAVPYYSNAPTYIPIANLFVNAQLDWTTSAASWQHGYVAGYGTLTDGSRNALRERAVITASWMLDEVLPNIPNPPSPFRKDVAGRLVLDIWGGSFDSQREGIESLADSGMMPAVALVHVWQHQGYDNGLPGHMPAADGQGGSAAMTTLVKSGESRDCLMALHENYVDYYPDYEKFDPNDIALKSDGGRMLAWFNESTHIQSFAIKPTAIGRLSRYESTLIHDAYGTNSCYLDVHSAVTPGFHTDYRAGEPQAGMMRATIDAHTQLWAFERSMHNGPAFGEGANHWFWSGLLDGVEAQPGVGWPNEAGMTMPLLVDFDLLKIHPLQINHGMGYYERWWGQKNPPNGDLMRRLDQYRMQEAIYAHAPFLGASTWTNEALAMLETELVRPVSMRAAASNPTAISYLVDGAWTSSTEAAIAGQLSVARVRYASGLVVVANSSDKTIETDQGRSIPQFGWYAEGAGFRGGTDLIDGCIADFADSGDDIFANARSAEEWANPGSAPITAQVVNFKSTSPRRFTCDYFWRSGQSIKEDNIAFVHFVRLPDPDNEEGIRFQQDHKPSVATSRWHSGVVYVDGPYEITVPAGIADGDYDWYIGLYTHDNGRLPISDGDDHSRIKLGSVRVAGDNVTFSPEPVAAPTADDRVNGSNKVLDFGDIKTNGCARVRRTKTGWKLTVLPAGGHFTLALNGARFGMPTHVAATTPDDVIPISVGRDGWWTLPLDGASQYRW